MQKNLLISKIFKCLSPPQRLKGFFLGGENMLNDASAGAGLGEGQRRRSIQLCACTHLAQ